MKKLRKLICFSFLVLFVFSCESWMKSDEFFAEIDEDVRVANAEEVNVSVRYAVTTQGTTTPSGSGIFKVDVIGDISCVTNTSFGFHHWAAFSSDFFNTQGQNKNIIYESGEGNYDDTILKEELGEDVVSFGDEISKDPSRYSPSTTVKIHKKRDDIVLVPVVASRPTIDRLSPMMAQAGVVRNTSLRYLFTKKMDLSTFSDENIKISSGYSVMTDQEDVSDDITDMYIWKDEKTNTSSPVLSTNGKMVTFRLRPDKTLDPNRQITVNLSNGIKDSDGYEMESDQKIYFTTGTSVDSLAPRIEYLKCGVGTKFLTYDSIERNGDEIKDEDGKIKPLADAVFDPYFESRVQDKINIYLYANDIVGAGANVDVSGSNTDEDVVAFYGIRAKLLYDSNGESANNEIPAAQKAYFPNGNDIPVKTDEDKESAKLEGHGYAFEYDLSSLPDGLIAIDVWAMDNVGNNGLEEPYYKDYDNGYRTLLVVKDTSAPNIAAEKDKVISKSDKAIYGWYNKDTLNSTFIAVDEGMSIIDNGFAKLRAPGDKLKWIFSVGDDPSKWSPSATDSDWRNITAGDYPIGSINVQREGSIGILMALMDDLGNISETAILNNTVLSDLTKPVSSAPSWVDENGNPARTVSNKLNLNQYLKVPFTESLSGVREIAVDVDSVNGIQSGTKFYYNSQGNEISYTSREGNSCAVLTPPKDREGYESGTFFISGINIGNFTTDGIKTANVVLYDAAFNASSSVSATLTYDTTSPVVQSIKVNEVVSDGKRKWLSKNAFTGTSPNNASITVTAVEVTSGLELIKLNGAKLTPASKVYVGSSATGNAIPCTINEAAGTITIPYSENPVLKNPGAITFTITGISFTTNIDNGAANTVSVQLTDFAGNVEPISQNPVSDIVYIDSKPASNPSIKLYDSSTALGNNNEFWKWSDTRKSYTDSNIVYIEVSITGDQTKESGITTLSFENLEFDSNTKVEPSGTISAKSIKFNEILNGNNTIKISGAKIIEQNKSTSVAVSSTDLIGWTSGKGNDSILHDSIKPSFGGKQPAWLSVSGDNDGITDNFNQLNAQKKQKLSIPYSEIGSGIKLITISGATADGITSVKNGDTTLVKNTDYTIGKNSGKDYIVFTKPLVSGGGTIYIEGLSITNTQNTDDARLDVTISMYDAAENNDGLTSGNKATICIDETAPIITKAVISDAQRIQNYEDASNTYNYFFGSSNLQAAKTEVVLYIKEATSGIRTINFAGSIKPTSSSTITLNNTALNGFTVDKGVITFANAFTVCDTTKNEFALKITNCQIENIKTSAETTDINTISVTATDFAGLRTANPVAKATFTANNTSVEYTEIKANKLPSAVPVITLSDRGKISYDVNVPRTAGVTNDTIINASIQISPTTSTNYAQGIKIDSGGKFITSGTDETKIYLGTSTQPLLKGTDYTITENTIKFTKIFSNAITLKVNNISLSDSTNGEKTVNIKSFAHTAVESGAESGKILLDRAAPSFGSGVPAWISTTGDLDGITDSIDQTLATRKQKLKIPYSEIGSGIKLITISGATADGITSVKNGDTTLVKNTDYTIGKNSGKDYIVFTKPLVSGDGAIYIEGIKLAAPAGDRTHTITVHLYDTAENIDGSGKTANICVDSTKPDLKKIELLDVGSKKQIDNISDNYFFKHNVFTDGVTVTLTINEVTSGVKIINFSGDIKPTDASEIKMGSITYTKAKGDFTVSNGVITFANKHLSENPIKSSADFTLTITKCSISNIRTNENPSKDDQNTIKVSLTDFANNSSNPSPKTDIVYNSASLDTATYKLIANNFTPTAVFYAAASESTTTPKEADDTGAKFGRTYVNGDTTYFNSKARLGITYTTKATWFNDDTKLSSEPASTSGYSVKARVCFTDDRTSAKTYSDYYYFTDKTEKTTFFIEYPNASSSFEEKSGKLYLEIEDTVGNAATIQIYNGAAAASGAKTFCYNNEPPEVTLPGVAPNSTPITTLTNFGTAKSFSHLNFSTEDDLKNKLINPTAPTKIYVDGNTIILNGGTFKFDVSASPSGYKYGYFSTATETITFTNPANPKTSEAVNFFSDNLKTIPTTSDTLIPEKGVGVTGKDLYLYLLDNIGNISITKLGDTNLKWLKDTKLPEITTTTETRDNSNNSIINKSSSSGETILTIMIAASSDAYQDVTDTTKNADYTVTIPTSWFTDNFGSGFWGIKTIRSNGEEIFAEKQDNDTFSLVIPNDIAKKESGSGYYYVCDNVGLCSTRYTYNSAVDEKAPKVGLKLSVGSNYIYSDELVKDDDFETFSETTPNTSTGVGRATAAYAKTSRTMQNSVTNTLWTNNSSVNLDIKTYDENGVKTIKVEASTNGGTSYTTLKTESNDAATTTEIPVNGIEIKNLNSNPITLLRVTVGDFSGNEMVYFVNIKYDEAGPSIYDATITPTNDGAMLDSTILYCRQYKIQAKMKDEGVGLYQYKAPGSSWSNITSTDIGTDGIYSHSSSFAYDLDTDKVLSASDKLDNKSSFTDWKINETSISKVIIDRIDPTWNTTKISRLALNFYVDTREGNGTEKSWKPNPGDNRVVVVNDDVDTSNLFVDINTEFDANVEITPSANDNNKIRGFIAVKESDYNSSTKPAAPASTVTLPTKFILSCSKVYTASEFVTADNITTATPETSLATDVNFKLRTVRDGANALAANSLVVYFYPVDYAGNVGDAQKVTIRYNEHKPIVDGAISIATFNDNYTIYLSGGVNYFKGNRANDGSPGEATGEDETGVKITAKINLFAPGAYPLTGFKIVDGSGNEYAHHTYKTGITSTSSLAVRMPYSFASKNTTEDLYIVYYNQAGDSIPQKLEYDGNAKWAEDITPPQKPQTVKQVETATSDGTAEYNGGDNGFYLKNDSGSYTLYYSDSSTTAYLYFTASDPYSSDAPITSGFKGVNESSTIYATGASNITKTYPVTVGSSTSRTFYSYDNVLQRETDGITITFAQDSAKPTISDTYVSLSGDNGNHIHATHDSTTNTKTVYYNASTTDTSKNTSKITVEFTPQDVGTGVKTVTVTPETGTALSKDDSTGKYTLTITSLSATTFTISATDYVGNTTPESDRYKITLVPDGTAPTISVLKFSNDTTEITSTAESSNTYLHIENSDWRTVSGGTIYFNANTGKITDPKIEFTATDSSSSLNDLSWSPSILTTDGTSTEVTATATDKVGNTSTFKVTFIADTTAPVLTPSFTDNDSAIANTYKNEGTVTETNTSGDISKTQAIIFNADTITTPKITFTSTATDLNGDGVVVTNSTILKDDGESTVVTAKATDKVGNESTYTITFTADKTAPEIIPSFTDNGLTIADTYKDEGSVTTTTTNGDVSKKQGIIFNADTITTPKITFASTDTDLNGDVVVTNSTISKVDGTSTEVTATATDKVGHTSTYTVTFTADAAAPTITTSFTDNGSTIADTYKNEGTVAETNTSGNVSKTQTIYFNANTTKIANPKITFTSTDTNPGDITYTLGGVSKNADELEISHVDGESTVVTATAIDKVGHTSTYTVTFIADKTAPEKPSVSSIVDSSNNPITDIYPALSSWTSGNVFFKASSGTVSFSPTTESGSGLKGIYKWTDSAVGDKLEATDLVINAEKTYTVVSVDNVGNASEPFTITIAPDDDAPEIETLTGTFHILKANSTETGNPIKPALALYETSSPPTVKAKDDGSGITKYKLVYGSSAGTEPADADMTDYPDTGITLPTDITTATGNSFYLWLKDNIGNITSQEITTNGAPLGIYAQMGELKWSYASNKLTISGASLTAGVKKITIMSDNITTSTSNTVGFTTTPSLSCKLKKVCTDGTLTIEFATDDAYTDLFNVLITGDIEITLASTITSVSGVSITDAKDNVRATKILKTTADIYDSSDSNFLDKLYSKNGNNLIENMALYKADMSVTIPADKHELSDGANYAILTTTPDISSIDTSAWTNEYSSSTGLVVSNALTTLTDNKLWLCTKDANNNIDIKEISLTCDNLPFAKYVNQTTTSAFSYTYETTSNKILTIANYPSAAGIKSITITSEEKDASDNTKNIFHSGITSSSLNFETFSDVFTATCDDSLTFTFNDSKTVTNSGNIVIVLYYPVPSFITSVSIVDAAGNTIKNTGGDITVTPSGASMAPARAAVSSARSAVSKVTTAVTSVASTASNFFSRSDEIPPAATYIEEIDTAGTHNDTTKSSSKSKKSQKTSEKTTPQQTVSNLIANQSDNTTSQNDRSAQSGKTNGDTRIAQNTSQKKSTSETLKQVQSATTPGHSELVSESHDNESHADALSADNTNSNKIVAENKIIDYNYVDELFDKSDSSKLVVAIAAIVVSLVAMIILGLVLLLMKKRIK